MLIARLLIAAFAAFALLAAACGDDDGGPASPTATFPPGFTPVPDDFLTPQPPPAVDPNVEFARFQGEKWPYNIGYPEGWVVDVAGPSVDEFELHSQYGEAAAIHLRCGRSITEGTNAPEGLARDDADAIRDYSVRASTAQEVDLNGRRAIKWDYSVAIPGTPVRAWTFVYYIQGDGDCSWRLSLQTIGTTPVVGYSELLDRVAQEFQPGVAG